MLRTLIFWALLAGLLTATTLWVTTSSGLASLVGGAAGAVFALLCGWRVGAAWKHRADAFAAAARGLTVEPLGEHHTDDPSVLAREVQSTAARAKEMARQLSVLRAVIDGMAEGVWITSEDGTVLEHNDALKEMLYTGTQLVGHRPLELLRSAELQDAVMKACRDHLPGRLELAIEGVRPAVLSIHVAPLGRDLGGSAAVFFDVTELRRLEKVRKDFVANVSHELRTPITAIRGYAETLISGAINDPVNAPKMVDIIHRQSEHLSELVEDLLELSRLESRQIQLAARPVELSEVARSVTETVRPKSRARNIGIDVQIAPKLFVLGDHRAIEQVLLNLVDNAVKYTPPGGHVWVTAARTDGEIELAVKDDGQGIEARHLPRIFERFYRVDKGRSRDMGGTGLGLSIVKHLTTAMKGDVRVESTPGQGSAFFVALPAADERHFGENGQADPPFDSAQGL